MAVNINVTELYVIACTLQIYIPVQLYHLSVNIIGASLSEPHTYVKYSERVCISIYLLYVVLYTSIWCYENGRSWRTVAYSLQKGSHDMVNT